MSYPVSSFGDENLRLGDFPALVQAIPQIWGRCSAASEDRAGKKSRQRTFQPMPVQVVNLSVRTVKMRSLNAVLFCQNLIRLCQRLFSQSAPGQPPPPEKVGKTEDHKKQMLGGEFRTIVRTACTIRFL